MPEALARIRGELGEQAIILDSRPIKQKGVWGWFGKRRFEVIAAVDGKVKGGRGTAGSHSAPLSALSEEMQTIKRMMEHWMDEQRKGDLPPAFAAVEKALRRQHVANEVITSVFKAVRKRMGDSGTGDEETVHTLVAEEIRHRFSRSIDGAELPSGGQELIYFIGPTGVGKTTTIAKIAANYVLDKGLSVGLIAADTYRIAAVEQLRTYANILDIPLQVVHDPSEMEDAKQKLAACDLILVDTAGRNYRQKMNVSELFTYIERDRAEIHLVLSMFMRDDDVAHILDNIASRPVTHLLLTKADEAGSFGLALNLASKTDYPIRFITTGQNVPDDIVVARADVLTDWVMGGNRYA